MHFTMQRKNKPGLGFTYFAGSRNREPKIEKNA